MEKYRMNLSQLSLNKRLAALLPPFFALVFLCVACGKLIGTSGSPVSYTQGSGQILIRLINSQGNFSILHFLQSYQPTSSHPYAAPGIVMLVRPFSDVTTPVAQWPYPDISLQQVATQECQTLYNYQASSCAATSGPSGYFPLYGKRGTDLLNRLKSSQNGLMSQGSQTYAVLAWPLLPENLVVQTDGKQWVQTEGMNGGRWPLLPGAS